MHLSPIKGAYPHKDQHDRTAPIKEGNGAIERGSVIMIDGETGEFRLAGADDTGPFFLALQRYDDLQAAMAGRYSPASGKAEDYPWKTNPNFKRDGEGKYNNAPLQGGVIPAISGIHMDDGDVWEDDMFDADADWDNAEFNAPIAVKDGGYLTLAEGDDAEVVGFLVKKPYKRYCNDAEAVKGMMTGAYRYVIQFQCGK